MALARELPYLGCHFQVRWTTVEGPPQESGFSEVLLPPICVDASGMADAAPDTPGLGAVAPGSAMGLAATGGSGGGGAPIAATDAPLLVLRRGFAGSLDLYQWCNDTRLGTDKRERKLTVDLLDGERGRVVCRWEFSGVRPVQLDYAPLQALGASVLVETLTLRYASMTMK